MKTTTKFRQILSTILLAVSTSISAQNWVDVTDAVITNSSFKNGFNGWNCTQDVKIKNGCVYGSTSSWFDIYQLVELPTGTYKVSCQGFERLGTVTNAWNSYQSKDYTPNVTLRYGTFFSLVHNLFDEPQTEEFTGSWKSSTGEYFPSSVEGAISCFEKGMYVNEVTFTLDEPQQTILGLYSNNSVANGWYVFTNLRLYRDGDFVHASEIRFDEEDKLEMSILEERYLNVSVLPKDAVNQNVIWETSDASIATIDESGKITALKEGTCTITARSADPSVDVSATATINITTPKGKAKDLIVNEITASNGGTYLDPSFNYGSWLELYNPSSEAIILANLYISDDPENLHKFKLPIGYGVIAAGAMKCIHFDHNGIWNVGETMQVNFDLDFDGGTIYISDDNGIILQQEYPESMPLTSYARTTDGGNEWGYSADITPGRSNAGMRFATERAEAPIVNRESCIFDADGLDVVFKTPNEQSVMYITFDGSIPTDERYNIREESELSFPLEDGNYNIRIRTYEPGKLPSDVYTYSYIRDKGFTLPIISITGSDQDLYGYNYGILNTSVSPNGRAGNGHSNNYNVNMDWDRPVHFDYFTQEGEHVVSQEVNMAKCGGWSRFFMPHSFKLKANKHLLGENTIDYQFFDNKPYLRHKALQIRQGGNDNTCRIKDAALQQIILRSGINVDAQECQPVHVLFNGAYQGTLNMREPNNKHFAYANYGINTDEMDQFEMSPDSGYVQKEGTKEAFLKWYELSADAANADTYEEIKKLVDIEEYINYMAIEFYLANNDWPRNNVKGYRDRNDGKFRFVIYDLDQAFDVEDANTFSAFKNKKTWIFDTLHGVDAYGNNYEGMKIKKEIELVTIFYNMLQNDEFRKRFIDTFCIVAGSVFAPDRVKEIVTEMKNTLVKARNSLNTIFRENSYDSGSWFDPTSSANKITSKCSTTRNNNMVTTVMKNHTEFKLKSLTAKTMRLSSNLPEAKVYLNDIEVPTGKFDGKVYTPAIFTTKAPAGYRFRGWTKSRDFTLSPDDYTYISTDAVYELPTTITGATTILTAIYEAIPEDEIADSHRRPVMINEVSAKNSIFVSDYFKKSDWLELYNTTDSDIDIAGLYITDHYEEATKYQVPVDDPTLNTVIPAHGYKVIWTDKKDNISSQIHAGFKLNADGGEVMITADPSVAHKSLFNDTSATTWTDTISYSAITEGQTIGRYPDGASSTYVMTIPSIGKANQIGIYAAPLWLDPIETSIHAVEIAGESTSTPAAIYNLNGIKTASMQRGINIIRYSDGTVKKVKR